MTSPEIVTAGESRVWLIENGFGPASSPEYQGCMKVGDSQWGFGDVTRIECPDPDRYDGFLEVAAIPGETSRPTFSLMGHYQRQLSDLLRLARRNCDFGVLVAIGRCKNPQDLVGGWDKLRVYPKSRVTQWGDENAGALQSGERNPTEETAELSAREIFEIVPLTLGEAAAAVVTAEILKVVVCDSASCGDCGDESTGCQKVFATMIGVGATPGTKPSVVFSDDSFETAASTLIDTLFSNELPADAACVGGNLVIVSPTGGMHYASIAGILAGTETWVESSAGLVIATGGPNAIWSADASHTWIVGEGGYIYFTANPTLGVVVQDAGSVTAQGLNDVHAYSTQHVLAVGDANVVVFSSNGGASWQLITGPSVAVNLTACWMLGPQVWFVGNAAGGLYFTLDGGDTWTQAVLPVATTAINEIQFANEVVGYIAADVAGPAGVMLRTVTGGNSWYIVPEEPGAPQMPTNQSLNSVAACSDDPNVAYVGGLGAAADGIIVKAVGA